MKTIIALALVFWTGGVVSALVWAETDYVSSWLIAWVVWWSIAMLFVLTGMFFLGKDVR